jgi:hypothetical protein
MVTRAAGGHEFGQPPQARILEIVAVILQFVLRRVGLGFTQFADASAQTIYLRLLKLGAQVRTLVRRSLRHCLRLPHPRIQRRSVHAGQSYIADDGVIVAAAQPFLCLLACARR